MLATSMNPVELLKLEYFELQKLANLSNSQVASLFLVNAATVRGWRSTSDNKVAPKSVKATLVNIITGALAVNPQRLLTEGGTAPTIRSLIDARYHAGVSEQHKDACDQYAEHQLSGGGFFESLTQGQYKDAYERAHTLVKPHFDAHMHYTHQFQALLPKDDPLYRPLGKTLYTLYHDSLYAENATDFVCTGEKADVLEAVRLHCTDHCAGYYTSIIDVTLCEFDSRNNRRIEVLYIDPCNDEETTNFYLVPQKVIMV
tara:strand:+ start:171376 stop:172149 length:774 start_codon:yes stop_codon:yes gene_type:complete